MKKNLYLAAFFFTLAIFSLTLFSLSQGAENLYDSVIRIHVLANSDSPEDQRVKIAVRDALLSYAKEELSSYPSQREAKIALEERLPQIEREAERTLAREGFSYGARVVLDEEYYDTRTYEDFSLPAGEYLSLQVLLGEGEGQNWWCVLFPPICVNSAKATEDALADAGMEEENVRTVTVDKTSYRIRFRLLDLVQSTKRKFSLLFS